MPDTTLRSRYVMAGRIRTHYSETGSDGPPVVLLHGGGPGSSGAAGFGKVMLLLADRFWVIAPDGVGGYGDTDPYWPASEGGQSRVDQLEAFVDTLCLERFCLAGNSQGAWVAAKYTLDHPDRVRKLFLIGSNTIASALGMQTPETEPLKARRGYDGSKEAMQRMMAGLVYDKANVTDELIAARQASANRPGAARSREIYDDNHRRLMNDPNLRLKFDLAPTLPKLTLPGMFIWGEEDAFAPPSLGRQVEAMLPNFPFTWIPKAGHQAQTDQPEMVAELMAGFFGS